MSFEEWLIAVCLVAGAIGLIVRTMRRRDRWGVNLKTIPCPNCGTPFPRVRKPTSLRQAMWGGSSCAACGIEIDKWGKKL